MIELESSGRPLRLAWFSPMPPVRSGVAAVSADLVPALRAWHEIDVFVDAHRIPPPPGTRSAHDFVWLHQQRPYDLTVFQLGNSSAHDYLWPYLFRYPGLTVLHDAHLHHARAAALLRAGRKADYRTEFVLNQPDANPDLAELVIAGFDSQLYYRWPMTRLVAERSKVVAVHGERIACRLREESPGATVEAIRLGHGVPLAPDAARKARAQARAQLAISPDAVVFGVFGGLSPDKRVPQILAAFAAARVELPSARLLLAGGVPEHYDLQSDVERFGLGGCTTVTGYLDSDDDLGAHIEASDVALNLRWPTAREVSGPWLRCLAAGKPTVILHLEHLIDVPSLDPRTWLPNATDNAAPPVAVAVDLLDEEHSLRRAMRRLARDRPFREALGRAAREYWQAHHAVGLMVEDYRRVITLACSRSAPGRALPPHLLECGRSTLDRVLSSFGVADPLR